MAYPPSSVAGRSAKAPRNLPIGVRAPPRRTEPIPQFYTGAGCHPARTVGTMPAMINWAGPEALPGVIGLDHVGIAVDDLDAAVTLHTEVLGLTVEHREANADQGVVEVMLLAPGGSGPGTQMQLVAALDEHSSVHRFLARRG